MKPVGVRTDDLPAVGTGGWEASDGSDEAGNNGHGSGAPSVTERVSRPTTSARPRRARLSEPGTTKPKVVDADARQTPVTDGDLAITDEREEFGDLEVEEASTSSPRLGRRARGWVVENASTAVTAVVALALAIALALTLVTLNNRNALESARTSALNTARTDSVELAGYNYQHLDRDFAAVLANSTPTFRRNFRQAADALKRTLTKYHATAAAKVVSAGLVSASTSRAVALVFLDQKISNSAQKAATTDRSQVEITLVRSGDKWLINQVSLL